MFERQKSQMHTYQKEIMLERHACHEVLYPCVTAKG